MDLWSIGRGESVLAAMTFLGVVPGMMIGVVLALVLLVEKIGRPSGSTLGRISDGQWHNQRTTDDAIGAFDARTGNVDG